ncbi:MAG TPA: cupin domain-containing protein [Candidatus Limnocylindrales bacterium]|nr:cupin domain-containing protein [Candidatus Limnocylindrales bacterium]
MSSLAKRIWQTAALLAIPLAARQGLLQRMAHADPSQFRPQKAVHGGAGQLTGMILLDSHSTETNFSLLHRAVLEPKSGVGAHFHNTCEEMFIILDGEAQFTIDGRTSVLKGPAGAICRMGHSHAIYNATDKPVQWLNIQVTSVKGASDAYNLEDARIGVPLDPIPVFMSSRFDRALLQPVEAMDGGKGVAQYRRVLNPSVFLTPWAYLDQIVLPPGASLGPHLHREVGEVFYVVKGQGKFTVSSQTAGMESATVREGDALPLQLGEMHSVENTGSEPLEMLIIGVSRDSSHGIDTVDRQHFAVRAN